MNRNTDSNFLNVTLILQAVRKMEFMKVENCKKETTVAKIGENNENERIFAIINKKL